MISGLRPYPEMKDSGVQWLGEVPAHWSVRRLKSVIGNIVEQTSVRRATDLYLALEHVESWTGQITRTDEDIEFDSQVKVFRAGDILFGKLRPYLAKVTCPKKDGVCVGEFLVLRPRDAETVGPYMERLLRSKPIIDAVNSSTFGAKMPRADWQFMGSMAVVRPSVPEQATIVRFLEHADRRIRRYIRAKEKLMALLEEQREAIIHKAVTGEIDLRTGNPYASYRHSGSQWLSKIPAHWEVRRSKRVFRPRKELARPGDIQLSATQAYGVISQEDYERRIGRKVVRISRHLEQRKHVEVNDFVISMRSFQGGLERAWKKGCIRSSYIVLRPVAKLASSYFGYLFKSAGYIGALQSTADFIRDGQDLNFDNFCKVDLPFPPVQEQQAIGRTLDEFTKRITLAGDHTRHQIKSLWEYRRSLIAAVVTGKVDVRVATSLLPTIDGCKPGDDPNDGFGVHGVQHGCDRETRLV